MGQICPGLNPEVLLPCPPPPPPPLRRGTHGRCTAVMPWLCLLLAGGHWEEKRRQLGGAGPDAPTAPRSCGAGFSLAHTCARCIHPCPCASDPMPLSCWVIAFLKCQVHPAMLMKYSFALPGSQSSEGIRKTEKPVSVAVPPPGKYWSPGAPRPLLPGDKRPWEQGKPAPRMPKNSPHHLGNGLPSENLDVRERESCESKEGGTEPLLPRECQHTGVVTAAAAVLGAHCGEWDYKYNPTDNKALISMLKL